MLTHAQIARIRALAAAGHSQSAIARSVGVSQSTVSNVLRRSGEDGRQRWEIEANLADESCPPWRCPRCRALLITEWCLACRVMHGQTHRRPDGRRSQHSQRIRRRGSAGG